MWAVDAVDLTVELMNLPIAPIVYLLLAGTYLVVLPALAYLYMRARWYTASSIERLLMYFMTFLLFPGLLLLAPFLNFRPQPRQMN
jgi:NAD(P)H-quinone oxidoreductase subunit L